MASGDDRKLWRRVEKVGEKLLKGEDENVSWWRATFIGARFSTEITVRHF